MYNANVPIHCSWGFAHRLKQEVAISSACIKRRCARGIWVLALLGLVSVGCVRADAVNVKTQAITHLLSQEPPSLNSTRATDQVSFFVLGHLMEGLLRYDPRGALIGGVASNWHMEGVQVAFDLREDARWSDGSPVTADDFVFAWRTLLDPATGAEYASIAFPIKNAEAVNRGELPVAELGVRAVTAHRLEVELERPTAYFLELMAFQVFLPIKERFYREMGQRYAADLENLLYNGPFRLTRWVHGAHLRFERNEMYWARDQVRLRTIDMPYFTTDPTAAFNLFKDGQVVLTGLSAASLPEALRQRVKLRTFLTGTLFYLEFNHREGHATANVHLRRAIQRVFDPDEFVNKVIAIPGLLPGRSIFPVWLRGVEQRFRQEYPAPRVLTDLVAARAELAQAKQQLGVDQIPPLVLLTGDTPESAKQAEYLQYLLKASLGLELKIDQQIFKQRLTKMLAGQFDLVAAGWGPDYNDVMTFGDLFASWNVNNRGRYRDPEYDHWVKVAQGSTDRSVRMEAMAALQRIAVEDVVVLPQYESATVYLQHPQLKGLVRRVIGPDPDFSRAWVSQEPVDD